MILFLDLSTSVARPERDGCNLKVLSPPIGSLVSQNITSVITIESTSVHFKLHLRVKLAAKGHSLSVSVEGMVSFFSYGLAKRNDSTVGS